MNTKCLKRGFTLIELLVVVLIIGILAAVALPQYQKAVDKSRVSQVVQLIASLQKATEVWILGHGGQGAENILCKNATDFLDIDLPCEYDEEEDAYCQIGNNIKDGEVDIGTDGSAYIIFKFYFANSGSDPYISLGGVRESDGQWIHKCGYYNDRGKAICDGLQGYTSIQNWEY